MNISRKYKKAVSIIGLLALLQLPASLQAWSPPSSPPTQGNSIAPLNVSSTGQSKAGGLLLNTGGAANGLIVQFGNMGLGTTSPSAKFAITALGSGTGRAFALANSSNVEKVTILDSGKLGISRSNPAYALDVGGDLNATRLCISDSCRDSWPVPAQWTVAGSNINYTAGNVGIGTTTPASKVSVAGGVQVSADGSACSIEKAGTLRWAAGLLEVCSGSYWTAVGQAKSCPASGGCQKTVHGVVCDTFNVLTVPYGSSCPTPTSSRCQNGNWSIAPLQYSNCTPDSPPSGCMDPAAENYDPNAVVSDPSACTYSSGCKYDTTACNYDPNVYYDDPASCSNNWNDDHTGCMDSGQ